MSETLEASLLRLLTQGHKPMRLDGLLKAARLPRQHKREVERALESLARQGTALRMPGGLWMAASLLRSVEGRYSVLRSGTGLVTVQRPRDRARPTAKPGPRRDSQPETVYIHPSQAGDAWHNDMVRVVLSPGRGERNAEGRIVEVLARGNDTLPARVLPARGERVPGMVWAKPADARYPFTLQVDVSGLEAPPKPDELLLVRPGERLAHDLWAGVATGAFGREDDVAVQERLVKLNHQAPAEFPSTVLAEAAALPTVPTEADMAGREDLRGLPFVTIDGADARDFDDAIYVEAAPGGWLLRVAIADVTHYVRPRSALDTEAKERANSWYFPTSVEPMLPEALSNGLCSLRPDEDKLVMLAEVHVNTQGLPGATRFAPAVMRSAARLTYDNVKRAFLDDDADARAAIAALPRGAEVIAMMTTAFDCARALAARRAARGALEFSLPEPEYVFDDAGRILDIRRKHTHFAHQLIEEFMICANEAVARFVESRGAPFLYRVHPVPEAERLAGLFRTLASTSLATALPAKAGPAALRTALDAARGTPQEFLVGRLCLRAMPQARYLPENEGHFGLASACYCHFTSPIRRYADVVVHRALKHALGLDSGVLPAGKKLLIVADQLNRQERAAQEAEREMARRLAVLALEDRVGETFAGVVAGVSDFGIFVELDAMPVEGMVRLDSVDNDLYAYDQERQELTGLHTGTRFYLGQRLETRLVEVNPGRLEITLELTEIPAAGRRRGKGNPPARREKQRPPVKRGKGRR